LPSEVLPSSHKGSAAALASLGLGAATLAAAKGTPSVALPAPSTEPTEHLNGDSAEPGKMAAAVTKVVANTTARLSARRHVGGRRPATAPRAPKNAAGGADALEAVLNTMRAAIGARP